MTAVIIVLAVVLALGVLGYVFKRRFERMPSKKKKKLFTKTINDVYRWFEDHGLMRRDPAFIRDYHKRYRGLAELDRNSSGQLPTSRSPGGRRPENDDGCYASPRRR